VMTIPSCCGSSGLPDSCCCSLCHRRWAEAHPAMHVLHLHIHTHLHRYPRRTQRPPPQYAPGRLLPWLFPAGPRPRPWLPSSRRRSSDPSRRAAAVVPSSPLPSWLLSRISNLTRNASAATGMYLHTSSGRHANCGPFSYYLRLRHYYACGSAAALRVGFFGFLSSDSALP